MVAVLYLLHLIRGGVLRGVGEGREFAISDGIFLTYMLLTYSLHTDISHVGGHLACGLLFDLLECPVMLVTLILVLRF